MNNYLIHRDHKYISREWKNGRWQYTYPGNGTGKGNEQSNTKEPAPPHGNYTKYRIVKALEETKHGLWRKRYGLKPRPAYKDREPTEYRNGPYMIGQTYKRMKPSDPKKAHKIKLIGQALDVYNHHSNPELWERAHRGEPKPIKKRRRRKG